MDLQVELEKIRDKSPAQYAIEAKNIAQRFLEEAGYDRDNVSPAVLDILDTSIGRLEGRQRGALLRRARDFNETVAELIPLLQQRFPDRFDSNYMTQVIGAIYSTGRHITRNDALTI